MAKQYVTASVICNLLLLSYAVLLYSTSVPALLVWTMCLLFGFLSPAAAVSLRHSLSWLNSTSQFMFWVLKQVTVFPPSAETFLLSFIKYCGLLEAWHLVAQPFPHNGSSVSTFKNYIIIRRCHCQVWHAALPFWACWACVIVEQMRVRASYVVALLHH